MRIRRPVRKPQIAAAPPQLWRRALTRGARGDRGWTLRHRSNEGRTLGKSCHVSEWPLASAWICPDCSHKVFGFTAVMSDPSHQVSSAHTPHIEKWWFHAKSGGFTRFRRWRVRQEAWRTSKRDISDDCITPFLYRAVKSPRHPWRHTSRADHAKNHDVTGVAEL